MQILIECCFQHFLVKSLLLGLSQFHAWIGFPSPGIPPWSDIPRTVSPLWAAPSCTLNLGFKLVKTHFFCLFFPHFYLIRCIHWPHIHTSPSAPPFFFPWGCSQTPADPTNPSEAASPSLQFPTGHLDICFQSGPRVCNGFCKHNHEAFPKGKHSQIPAIFGDTFDSGLDLCPGCQIKRAEGRVQKRPFTPADYWKPKPGGNAREELEETPAPPCSPRKDVIILFSKVRSVYRNKHLSENRHEMLERQKCAGAAAAPRARLGTSSAPSSNPSSPPKSLVIQLIY